MQPSATDAARAAAQLEHAAQQVAFWDAMRTRLHLDRRNLRFVPPVGAALAAVVYLWVHLAALALGVLGVAVGTWLMGLYFVSVRAQEYNDRLAESRAALEAARAALPR